VEFWTEGYWGRDEEEVMATHLAWADVDAPPAVITPLTALLVIRGQEGSPL
jgi:hypothetical protein